MAVKRITTCDRCGCEISKGVFLRVKLKGNLELWSLDHVWPVKDMDIILCPSCTREMLRFIGIPELLKEVKSHED